MPLKIYLARHGQDEDNAAGILNGRRNQPLTPLGIQQAQTLAQSIQDTHIKFSAVYTSPLQRAHDTALAITNKLSLDKPPIVMEDLVERDFGIMSGKPTKDIASLCSPDVIQTDTICYFLKPDGAETFPQLVSRGQSILDQIYSKHKQQIQEDENCNVLLVAHDMLVLSECTQAEDAHVLKFQQYNL
eukprot:15344990-Ditylum_brightwellii.AAC.1